MKPIKPLLILLCLLGYVTPTWAETVTVWAANEEIKPYIEYFEKNNPGIKVNLINLGNNYTTKIRNTLRIRRNVPDIFSGDVKYIREYIERGIFLSLEGSYQVSVENQIAPYSIKIGQDAQGTMRALSFQSTPGGFFYRRSLAKRFFNTDDPQVIGDKLKDWESFLEVAQQIKAASQGGIYMTMGAEPIAQPFLASRTQAYVDPEGFFHFDPAMDAYLEVYKKMYTEGMVPGHQFWSDAWFNALKTNKVFGVFLPTWGLKYNLMSGAAETTGDWALTHAISPFFWGGTWFGVYKDSKVKKAAVELLKTLALTPKAALEYSQKTSDFPSNLIAQKQLLESNSSEFLQGQNHFLFFSEEAKKIPENSVAIYTRYDNDIRIMMTDPIKAFARGKISKNELLTQLKTDLKNAHPKIKFRE